MFNSVEEKINARMDLSGSQDQSARGLPRFFNTAFSARNWRLLTLLPSAKFQSLHSPMNLPANSELPHGAKKNRSFSTWLNFFLAVAVMIFLISIFSSTNQFENWNNNLLLSGYILFTLVVCISAFLLIKKMLRKNQTKMTTNKVELPLRQKAVLVTVSPRRRPTQSYRVQDSMKSNLG